MTLKKKKLMERFNVRGKRLLVLGSTLLIQTIVEKAQSMGVYVIVTDNKPYEKAPAKAIADKYYDISLADIDGILQIIRENHIDGILTGYTDSYLTYYLEICKKAGLPCYGSKHQFDIATDKVKFKEACIKSNVPVIPGNKVNNLDEAREIALQLGYPLMFKPADNSGSRGVNRCNGPSELEGCYKYSLSFSPSEKVICEKYLDTEIAGCSYQLVEGQAYLSSVSEHNVYKSKKDGSSVTKSLVYPSKHLPRYLDEVNRNVINMLKDNGFSNGMVSFQVFVDQKQFYFCEMCYRPSGGQHYVLIENQNGVNSLQHLIEFALTGSTTYKEIGKEENPDFKDCCAMIKLLGIPYETISEIKLNGAEKLPGVLKVQIQKSIGEIIGKEGTTSQCLASVWLKAENRTELVKTIRKMENTISITNAFGENLIIKEIDYLK